MRASIAVPTICRGSTSRRTSPGRSTTSIWEPTQPGCCRTRCSWTRATPASCVSGCSMRLALSRPRRTWWLRRGAPGSEKRPGALHLRHLADPAPDVPRGMLVLPGDDLKLTFAHAPHHAHGLLEGEAEPLALLRLRHQTRDHDQLEHHPFPISRTLRSRFRCPAEGCSLRGERVSRHRLSAPSSPGSVNDVFARNVPRPRPH